MTSITRYLLKTFLAYFLVVTTLLSVLYCLIEFFEKLTRTHNVSLSIIALISVQQFIPTFFGNFGQSGWLASLLFVRELELRNEWETFNLLAIPHHRILLPLCVGIIGISALHIISKEKVLHATIAKAHTQYKKASDGYGSSTTHHYWTWIDQTTVLYADTVDHSQRCATNITIAHFDEHKLLDHLITASKATIDYEKGKLVAPSFTIMKLDGTMESHAFPISYTSNALCRAQQPTAGALRDALEDLSLSSSAPQHTRTQVLLACMHTIAIYLENILLPLSTLLIFFYFPRSGIPRWIPALGVYPLFIVLRTSGRWLADTFYTPFWFGVPYGAVGILIALIVAYHQFSLIKISKRCKQLQNH
jgi:lipopolysaccharide export LptBFGC system permease protein LptF